MTDFFCYWGNRSPRLDRDKCCSVQCEACASPTEKLAKFKAAKQIQLTLFPRGQW
jgi:hypothetical protein